jgi:hypothetical protein
MRYESQNRVSEMGPILPSPDGAGNKCTASTRTYAYIYIYSLRHAIGQDSIVINWTSRLCCDSSQCVTDGLYMRHELRLGGILYPLQRRSHIEDVPLSLGSNTFEPFLKRSPIQRQLGLLVLDYDCALLHLVSCAPFSLNCDC